MEKRLHVPPAVRASGIKHLIHYVKNATHNNKKLFPNVRAVEFQWGFNKLCAGRNAPFVYLTDATWVGNPSGPTGHLPYKAEEFCLQTDKLITAMDYSNFAVDYSNFAVG